MQDLLHHLIHNLPFAVAMFDKELRYIAASKKWYIDYRLEGRRIEGLSHYEVFPEIPERWREFHRRNLAGEELSCDADPFPRADGSIDYVRWKNVPWRTKTGEVGGVIMYTELVGDLVATRRRLEDANKKLTMALAASSASYFEWNIESGDVFYSEETWASLGYTKDEWPDTFASWETRVHPDDRSSALYAINAHIRDQKPYEAKYRIQAKNGSWRWWRSQGETTRDRDGAPLRMFGINQDVTSLIEANETTRELDAYRQALDVHAIVSVANREGVITFANTNFCRISGFDRNELVGNTHRVVNSGFHSRHFFINMWRTISSGQSWHGQICNARKDGSRYWVDTTIVPVLHPNGHPDHYVSIRYDITRSKMLETELKNEQVRLEAMVEHRTHKIIEQNRELENALASEKEFSEQQRLFVSMVSHEIRTPLTVIDGAVGALKRRRHRMSDEKVESSLNSIARASTRMLRLMETTLTAAKIEAEKATISLQPLNLRQLLHEMIEERNEIARNARFSVAYLPEDEVISADEGLLYTALDNLISNAIKYGGRPAVVKLTARDAEDDAAVVISVEDNGIGIPEEEHPNIGQRFFRANAARDLPGTGLGLHIVSKVARLHGGRLDFESEVGVGSVFSISLPRFQGDLRKADRLYLEDRTLETPIDA